MASFCTRPSVRALALFLLLSGIADTAVYGLCAADPLGLAGTAEACVSACDCQKASGDTPLHAHHCFCQAQWIGMTDPVLPHEPSLSAFLTAGPPASQLESPVRRLDHPPQLPVA